MKDKKILQESNQSVNRTEKSNQSATSSHRRAMDILNKSQSLGETTRANQSAQESSNRANEILSDESNGE